MYNRYIPQSDGSYRRSPMPEPSMKEAPPRPSPLPREEPAPPGPPQDNPCRGCSRPVRPSQRPPKPAGGQSAGSFLRGLLPKDFDTEDLLIVLLLLLISGDCTEDRSTALLTLALYLFL